MFSLTVRIVSIEERPRSESTTCSAASNPTSLRRLIVSANSESFSDEAVRSRLRSLYNTESSWRISFEFA